MLYLEGVILARSSPIVLITFRPSTTKPKDIPKPPYSRIQIGVAACCETSPVVAINHNDTRGPIALLHKHYHKSF